MDRRECVGRRLVMGALASRVDMRALSAERRASVRRWWMRVVLVSSTTWMEVPDIVVEEGRAQ